jgi:hypothetical protein
MADFDVKLNFDDGGIVASLNKAAELYDKLNKEVQDLDKVSKTASKSLTNSLVDAYDESNRLLSSITKTGDVISKGFSKKEIGEVAIAIAKSADQAGKFSELIKKADTLRMNGVAADIQDLENEFVDLIEKVGLTDDQMELLKNEAGQVAIALGEITSGELDTVANKAEVLTKEFASAKSELRALTNAITSGELSGADLEVATQRAAALTDEIGDVKEQIRNLSSDTAGIDTLIEGTRAIAAGFAIAEGASVLFGDENEEVQKALLKLNAIMAIQNGLQEAHALLLQNSLLKMRANAIATGIYNTVVGASTGALKIFRIALASTGVGLLVILLGVLVANWDKVRKSVADNSKQIFEFGKRITTFMPPLNLLIRGIEWLYNNFERLDNIAAGVIDGIVAGLGAVGDVIGKLFDGDFSGAYAAAKEIGTKIGKATNDGIAEADKADANGIVAKQIDQVVASNKKRLELLEASGKDGSKLQSKILSDELKSLKLAGADKEKILEKEHEINLAAAERAAKFAESRKEAADKEKDRLKEFLNELTNLENEAKSGGRKNQIESIDDSTIDGQRQRLELQKKFDDEDIKQKEETTLKIAKTLEERQKLLEIFKSIELNANAEFNRQLIDLEKKARDEYNKVIEENAKSTNEIVKKVEIEKAKTKLETTLKGIKLSEDLQLENIERELKYGELTLNQQKELERQKLEIILNSLKAQRAAFGLTVNEDTIKLDNLIKNTEAELKKAGDDLAKPFASFKDLTKSFLQDSFGLSDKESEDLIEGFGALKSAILDVVNAGYEAELNAIDESISKREDAISELEGLIEDEYDKKLLGYANDYDALVAQKANEEALLKEDNKKRIEIQKEQLRTETAIQAAQQVGALVTAVANMVKSGSTLGVFGLPLIAASVIGLFAMYKNYKNQVKAINAQAAYRGGKVSDYLENGETAYSDRPGYGKGHRVQGTNLSIGADEFIMNAGTTEKQLPFLRKLNLGRYDNIDFVGMLDSLPDTRQLVVMTSKTVENNEVKNNKSLQLNYEEAMKKVIQEQTQLLLDADYRRPIITTLPDGTVEKVYHTKNGGKKTEIIRP